MKRSLPILATALIILSSALALPMASLDCPDSAYLNEFFTCTAYLYGYPGESDISYRIDSGGKLVIPDVGGSVTIHTGELWSHEFNVWAVEGGKAMVVFEYGNGGKQAHVAYVYVSEPPIKVSVPLVQAAPGRATRVKIVLRGTANDVRIFVVYPPVLAGDENIYVGDVDGERTVKITLTPDPFAVGNYSADVYVRFFDRSGEHTLLYKMDVEVGVPFSAYIALIAVLLVVGFIYAKFRKKGGQEK